MKKITLCLMLILALIIVPGAIFAAEGTAEVDTYQELVDALADTTKTTIKLVGGFELDSMVVVDREVTIDGAGYEITTKSDVVKSFEIHNTADEEIAVTFKNVTITNATSYGRAIDTRNDKINLTLDGVKLNTTSSSNNQALTLGGNETTGNLKVEMINSSATSAGKAGYGIITFVPGELTIKDSSVTGYAALYVKEGSSGLKVDVINSTLEGVNNHTGSDDSFGTIIVDESNVTINVSEKSTIKSSGVGEQVILGDRSTGSVGNIIDIRSATIDAKDAKGPFVYIANANTELSVGLGVTSNVEISREYLPEDVAIKYNEETGKFEIAERTIEVEGLKNVENAAETEKILLESFEKWEKDSAFAEHVANSNVTIKVNIYELVDQDVDGMPLGIWESFVEALNKKDENAKMIKKFIDISIYVDGENAGGLPITKLVKPITFKIELPELDDVAEGYERKYYAVRQHIANMDQMGPNEDPEIEYTAIDAVLSEDGKTLKVTSDKFSLFGIAYSDVEKPVIPPTDEDNTGDETIVTPPAGEGAEGETEEQPEVKPEVKPETDNKKEETPDVPQTGDNVVVYAVFAVVAIAGMAITIKMRRK